MTIKMLTFSSAYGVSAYTVILRTMAPYIVRLDDRLARDETLPYFQFVQRTGEERYEMVLDPPLPAEIHDVLLSTLKTQFPQMFEHPVEVTYADST